MKIIREYSLRQGRLICDSFVLSENEDELFTQMDKVSLSCRVGIPKNENGDVQLLRVECGSSLSLSIAVDEVIRFCQTIKQMYQL